MRDRSDTWIKLAARGEFQMETVAMIAGTEYSTITAPIIDRSLLSGSTLSVGNCIASTLRFTVMTTDVIPKSATVVIKSRLVSEDGATHSEWLEFGTFWVNTREINDDLIDLECYDAMMMANQAYSDNSGSMVWPKSMTTVVTRIAQQMGVSIDSRTTIKTGGDYVVTKPDSETKCIDILEYIAGIHGGNWIITPENKLRLVPLVSPPAETFNVIDYDYNRIETSDDYMLVWKHPETEETIVQRAGGGLINVPVVTGEITTARTYSISRVTMSTDSEHVYTAGDDTGYELNVGENPYATQALCNALLTDVTGIVYSPFVLEGACYDPAAELGDWIVAGDQVRSVLYVETQYLDITFSADASAPGEDELEEEYPYTTAIEKTHYAVTNLNRETAVIKTEIQQTQSTISLLAESKVDKNSIRSTFALDPTNIILSAGIDEHGDPIGTITMNAGTLIVNGSNFSLDANGHLECHGATINGAFSAAYTPEGPYDPSVTGDMKIMLGSSGFTFYSDNILSGAIHESVRVETGPSGSVTIDDGLVFEEKRGYGISVGSTHSRVSAKGNNLSLYAADEITINSSLKAYKPSRFLDSNLYAGYTGSGWTWSATEGGVSLTFVNGLLVNVVAPSSTGWHEG